MGESLPTIHEDHIAGKGDNSLQHYNLVHKFNFIPQAELEAKHQKSKVELYSEVVYAVFTSASQMTAAKVMDIISKLKEYISHTGKFFLKRLRRKRR